MEDLFNEFCSFGEGHVKRLPLKMTSRVCVKLAKDCGLVGKDLTVVDVDLIFTKVKARGERKIDFNEFVECTRHWAAKKGMAHEELVEILLSCKGPTLHNVTEPDYSVFRSEMAGSPAAPVLAIADQPARTPKAASGTRASGTRATGTPAADSEEIHPDWYPVRNPNPAPGEEVYYVHRVTNETTWDRPLRPLLLASAPFVPPPKSSAERAQRARTPSGEAGSPYKSVFEKLTDPSLYTGAHRHRFDPDTGRGRGLRGRDSPHKGAGTVPTGASPVAFKGDTNTRSDEQIHDISQILMRRAAPGR